MPYSFKNDYSVLAHPRILEALTKYSLEENIPYGLDKHSENASKYIKETFGSPNGSVFFVSGGTQANMLFISYCLKHYEGVISCDTGHINVHETAAVEGSGHKIITVPNKNGKLSKEDILNVLKQYRDFHMVKPGMVYISNSTELGTIYLKEELLEIYRTCKENHLLLFIDGARLGSALTSKDNDIKYNEFGSLCDAYYVGGTKNGFLYGEALVINDEELAKEFRYHIKNKGAMLAKSYGVSIQFEEAFKDGLYFDIARSTNEVANKLKEELNNLNINISYSPTNQVFATFPKEKALKIAKEFGCEIWETYEETICIRFVTSFMSSFEDIYRLVDFIKKLD